MPTRPHLQLKAAQHEFLTNEWHVPVGRGRQQEQVASSTQAHFMHQQQPCAALTALCSGMPSKFQAWLRTNKTCLLTTASTPLNIKAVSM